MNDVRTGPAGDGPTIEVVPLGGLGEFGLNTMAITCGDTTIVVDAGAMFPGPELPGVDLIVPDLASETALGRYIRELLAIGQWREICIQPARDEPRECFDVYGVAAGPGPLPH